QHVRRLEVPVEYSLAVSVMDGFGYLLEVLCRLPGWQGLLAHQLGQVLALDVIHGEEVLALVDAHVVNGDYVRVLQGGVTGGRIPERQAEETIGAALFGSVVRELQTAFGTGEHGSNHSKGIRPRHPLHRRNRASVTKKMEKVSPTKVNEGNEEWFGHWQHRP